jgi:hypothetical protein
LYYLNVGTQNADDKVEEVEKMISSYESKLPPSRDLFTFSHVYPDVIRDAIRSITSKSVGCDGVSLSLLRLCLEPILPLLEHIFNFSLQTGVFPDIWKAAHIKPIPKVKNCTQPQDYRPISILCALSKVFEKLVYGQVLGYLDEHSILNHVQSGFRSHHSTITALINVTDDVKKAMDDRLSTLMVLLDFSKAFDCVHHRLLLAKLKSMGFSNSVLEFFGSYLCNRSQRVFVSDNLKSEWGIIKSGVPQGSVLGPLLFALYINDLPEAIKGCSCHMYADDVDLYLHFKDKEVEPAVSHMNKCIENAVNFTSSHNLNINAGKTQPIIFGARRIVKRLNAADISKVVVNSIPVPYCEIVNNLGVSMDQTLSWNAQITKIARKALSSLIQIRRCSVQLPINIKKLVVQSLIFPQIEYGSILMSGISKQLSVKLQRIQNACIRFIYNVKRDVHITPYYRSNNLLKCREKRELYLAVTIYKIMKNKKPVYLYNRFKYVSEVNQRSTRLNLKCLHVPKYRTDMYGSSFTIKAASIWNHFKIYDYCTLSDSVFKKRITELLLKNYSH